MSNRRSAIMVGMLLGILVYTFLVLQEGAGVEEKVLTIQQIQQLQQQHTPPTTPDFKPKPSGVLSLSTVANPSGRWVWAKSYEHPDIIVVLGKADANRVDKLSREGFLVWEPRNIFYCSQNAFNCGSNFGFVQYLYDPSDVKPERDTTVFLDADEAVSIDSIKKKITEARASQQMTHLSSGPKPTPGDPAARSVFNDVFGKHRMIHTEDGARLQHITTSFVVPKTPMSQNSKDFYVMLYQFLIHDDRSSTEFFNQVYYYIWGGVYPPTVSPDGAYPRLYPAGKVVTGTYEHSNNQFGLWSRRTDPEFAFKQSTVVVFGGVTDDSSHILVDKGFLVWKCRVKCVYGPNCREHWGFLHYLADETGSKPTRPHASFIHGHLSSIRHHRLIPLWELLEDSLKCAVKTQRFAPLSYVPTFRGVDAAGGIVQFWNKEFGKYRTMPKNTGLHHFCCAQFTLPQKVIDANPKALYADSLEYTKTNPQSNGVSWELSWHFMFGENLDVNVSEDTCEPELPPSWLSPNKRANRIGVWDDTSTVDNLVIVIGLDYTDTLPAPKAFLERGYTVWVRRPLKEIHKGSRTEVKGYLTYLTDMYRVQREKVVFIRGDEEVDDAFIAQIKAAAAMVSVKKPFAPVGNPTGSVSLPDPKAYEKHMQTRCGARVFDKAVPDISRFVVMQEVIDKRRYCLTQAYITCDYDYSGSEHLKLRKFWEFLF